MTRENDQCTFPVFQVEEYSFFTYLFLGSFRLEETNKLLSAKIYMNRLKIVYFSVGE